MAQVGGIAGEQLRAFIERIERLEEEKKDVQEQIKEVFSEAKGTGFDVRIMRQLLRLRKLRDVDRSEQEELLEIYKSAIGMSDLRWPSLSGPGWARGLAGLGRAPERRRCREN